MQTKIGYIVNPVFQESETKDHKEFKGSLSQLYETLRRLYKNDGKHIVISLSRKGPKVIECCPEDMRISGLAAVTEFAIPFIMVSLMKGVTYHIILIDDAVYYGSTLRNLIKELREYERVLGLSLEITSIVALIDRDATGLHSMELHGRWGHRSGFGHYFVHHAMSQFRSLRRCMEVEFPIITYDLGVGVDIKQVFVSLQNTYKQTFINGYSEEDVITVLLSEKKPQFCKFRVYAEGEKLHFAFMSPYNLPHDKEQLYNIMDSMGQEMREVWTDIKDLLRSKGIGKDLSDDNLRNRERSLVVLANFIFSFQIFIKNRHLIEQALSETGYVTKDYDLSWHSLFQLTGHQRISDRLRHLLLRNARLNNANNIEIDIKDIPFERQLYEEEYSPSHEERNVLVAHNAHMIRNSQSVLEALSAVVFNQNLFMDRWARHGMYSPSRHLWFGYTHDILDTLIRRNARFSITGSLLLDLHRRMDRRIDQGCIVPQYIINPETRQWVRVFRPGENEDVLLSHLARYVIHVYNVLDRKLNIGFVPRTILDMVLAIVYKRDGEHGLKGQFLFTLSLRDNHLVWVDREENSDRDVLEYLKDMYILEINSEDEVTVAPRISDPEFLSNTTIDSEAIENIDDLILDMMRTYSQWEISYYYADAFFNYYLHEDAQENVFRELVGNSGNQIKDVLDNAIHNLPFDGREAIDDDDQSRLLQVFHEIGQYEVHPNFLDSEKFDMAGFRYAFAEKRFVLYQTQLEVMSLIINLMIGAYILEDIDDIEDYLNDDDVKRLMSMPKLNELNSYISQLWKTGREKELFGSSHFPVVLRNTLEKILN